MTQGHLSRTGNNVPEHPLPERFSAHRINSTALSLAASVAIFGAVQGAESMTYPEPQIVPVETADYYGTPQAPESPEAPEPAPPGEGPDSNNDIDVITIGEQGSVKDFWKPEIHFGATVGAIFQDNVFITDTNKVSDVILVASARATVAFGNVESWASRFIDTSSRALAAEDDEDTENLIAVTYAPTANYFLDNDNLNTVDQDVAGTFRWTFSKLVVSLDGRLRTLSDPDEDLGSRSDRTLIQGTLHASYLWSEKTRLEFTTNVLNRDYDSTGTDSVQIDGNAFVLYRFQPKTTVGIGLSFGELDLDSGKSQTFEQVLLKVRYNTFSKISYSATFGAELRQDESTSDKTNAVFQIGVTYQPANDTLIYFSAYERVEPSATGSSATIERTSFSLGINQRLLQKLSLSANLDYSIADYTAAKTSINADRQDKLFSISTVLTFEISENGLFRVGYVYRQDDSSLQRSNYQANQAMVSFTLLF